MGTYSIMNRCDLGLKGGLGYRGYMGSIKYYLSSLTLLVSVNLINALLKILWVVPNLYY